MTKNYEALTKKYSVLQDIPGYILVKDINSKYAGITNDFCKALGWNNANQAINPDIDDFNIPCNASESAEYFIEADQRVFKLKKDLIALNITNYQNNITSLLAHKKPIIDNSNQLIGIIIHCIDYTNYIKKFNSFFIEHDDKYLSNKTPKQYILSNEYSELPITPRQQECLALLIRGKTMKEIAFILKISTRTVEKHFEEIKFRLNCNNKSQLIEKTINNGFLFHLPQTLLGI